MNHVDNPFKSPAVLSLCPGFLGLERGLERAIGRINIVAYVEIEAFIIANLVAAMEQGILDPVPVWSDIKTFPAEQFRNKIHWIIGGYPCQPFSGAGNRLGTDDPRHLFPYILGIVKATNPVGCFFENVEGHLSLGYDTVYQSLRAAGYAVEPGIFSASEVGATHQRKRLFILAIRQDILRGMANAKSYGDIGICGTMAGAPVETRGKNDGTIINSESSVGAEAIMVNTANIGRSSWPASFDKGEWPAGTDEQSGNDGVWSESGRPSENQLANSDSIGHLHQQPEQQPAETGEHAQCNPATACGSSMAANIGLADTCSEGLQRCEQHGALRQIGKGTLGATTEHGSIDQWPARPGEQQHEWEEPRTIEPGMGCTVNGYNFREDLLRAYGNSVVEQTAELAFITLLNKHIENLSKCNTST